MEQIIKIRNLTKTYNPDKVPVHAVRGIDLEISKGEFTTIVGPSGSGKSTLLNLLGGLDKPTTGTVEIAGVLINNLSDNELIEFRLKNIGLFFKRII